MKMLDLAYGAVFRTGWSRGDIGRGRQCWSSPSLLVCFSRSAVRFVLDDTRHATKRYLHTNFRVTAVMLSTWTKQPTQVTRAAARQTALGALSFTDKQITLLQNLPRQECAPSATRQRGQVPSAAATGRARLPREREAIHEPRCCTGRPTTERSRTSSRTFRTNRSAPRSGITR